MRADAADANVRLTAFVHGHVQQVGFRWWTRGQALELGLAGAATNMPDGRVCVTAEGPRQACEELARRLAPEAELGEESKAYRRPGRVDFLAVQWGAARGVQGFVER